MKKIENANCLFANVELTFVKIRQNTVKITGRCINLFSTKFEGSARIGFTLVSVFVALIQLGLFHRNFIAAQIAKNIDI